MKLKTLALSVALLGLLSAIAFYATRPSAAPVSDPRVGGPLLDAAAASSAARIVVTDQGRTAAVARGPDGVWRVPGYYGFPADFGKVQRFVSDLNEARVQRFVSESPATLARLEFKDTRVALQDASGRTLWDATFGKSTDSGSGRFVRFGSEGRAFLTDLRAWIDADPKSWADAQVADIKAEAVASIHVPFADGSALDLSRSGPDRDWTATRQEAPRTLVDAKAAARTAVPRVRADAVASLLSTLGSLRFSDTEAASAGPVAAARALARTFRLSTFAGATWTFALGRAPEVKKPAAPAPEAPGSADASSPAAPVYAFLSTTDAHARLASLPATRALEVDDYTFTSLPNKAEDLLESTSAGKAPENP